MKSQSKRRNEILEKIPKFRVESVCQDFWKNMNFTLTLDWEPINADITQLIILNGVRFIKETDAVH